MCKKHCVTISGADVQSSITCSVLYYTVYAVLLNPRNLMKLKSFSPWVSLLDSSQQAHTSYLPERWWFASVEDWEPASSPHSRLAEWHRTAHRAWVLDAITQWMVLWRMSGCLPIMAGIRFYQHPSKRAGRNFHTTRNLLVSAISSLTMQWGT